VYASVYRTRQRGLRLPRPLPAIHGGLVLERWEVGTDKPTLRARLVDEEARGASSKLPDLYDAKVARITANGIMISGFEVVARRTNNKSAADRYKQTWWCLIHTVQLADALDLTTLDENFRPVPL